MLTEPAAVQQLRELGFGGYIVVMEKQMETTGVRGYTTIWVLARVVGLSTLLTLEMLVFHSPRHCQLLLCCTLLFKICGRNLPAGGQPDADLAIRIHILDALGTGQNRCELSVHCFGLFLNTS